MINIFAIVSLLPEATNHSGPGLDWFRGRVSGPVGRASFDRGRGESTSWDRRWYRVSRTPDVAARLRADRATRVYPDQPRSRPAGERCDPLTASVGQHVDPTAARGRRRRRPRRYAVRTQIDPVRSVPRTARSTHGAHSSETIEAAGTDTEPRCPDVRLRGPGDWSPHTRVPESSPPVPRSVVPEPAAC